MQEEMKIIINKEGNWFVAMCVENHVASQGKTPEEAIVNLKEAIDLKLCNSIDYMD